MEYDKSEAVIRTVLLLGYVHLYIAAEYVQLERSKWQCAQGEDGGADWGRQEAIELTTQRQSAETATLELDTFTQKIILTQTYLPFSYKGDRQCSYFFSTGEDCD